MMDLDFNKILQEASKIKENFEEKQEEFKKKTFSASSGGGMVTAIVNGSGRFEDLIIDSSLKNNSDTSDRTLEDLIIAAFNAAKENFDRESKAVFSEFTQFDDFKNFIKPDGDNAE